MNRPLVTIVIPTYNSTLWIEECLGSVKNQTYSSLETIVVDDGSSDNTVALVANFMPEAKIIQQENLGRGSARDAGLGKASGELIAFLDHDDTLLADSVEARVSLLQCKPELGWVFTDAMEFDQNQDLGLYLSQFPWLDLREDPFRQLLKGIFALTSTVMIRRVLLEQIGGFNPRINYGDDIELFLRLSLVSKVGIIRRPLTRRRMHPGQGVASTFDRWHSRVTIYSNFRPNTGTIAHAQQRALKAAREHACFKLGEWYWEHYDMNQARSCFASSMSLQRWTLLAIIYWTLTFIPKHWLKCMRYFRQRIFPRH